MTFRVHKLAFALAALLLAAPVFAQTAPPADRVVRMNGSVPAAAGKQVTLNFAIYDASEGGTQLWQETQTVAVDPSGQYSAFLGGMSADGLPLDVFAGGAPRWLAVDGPNGSLGARTLLAAVPYAVSAATAANATSLAGRPATDFLLTPAARRKDALTAGVQASAANLDGPSVNSGTANHIGKFSNTVDLVNSQLFDNGTNVGIGTTSPVDKMHVQFTNTIGTVTGVAVQNLGSTATSYSGMLFYDHTGALRQFQGYNNSTGEYRINNISPTASINFMTGSTSRFLVDGGTGNIGIGLTSPSYKLDVLHGGATGIHVKSTASFSVLDIDAFTGDAAIRLAADGVNQWNIRNEPSANNLQFFELGGGGERLSIKDGTGNIAIGGSSGAYKLDILHGGASGVLVKSSASYSTVDIDAFSGDAALRFANNGVNQWNIRNRPGDNYLEFFELGGGGSRMVIQDGTGYVGIGGTPTVPLEVFPTQGGIAHTGNYSFFNQNSSALGTGVNNTFGTVSIRATGQILANIFAAVSDERIKDIKGRSTSAVDLSTLRDIEVTDYIYKDTISRGGRPQKKVIAQQVERVYPQAVSQTTDVIPDIFKKAEMVDHWIALATDLRVGDRVRLITEDGYQAVHAVTGVEASRFRTDYSGDHGQVFVYGREVKDFRVVDYEAISMLNVSATQELARRLDEQTTETAALKQELAEMRRALTTALEAVAAAARNQQQR